LCRRQHTVPLYARGGSGNDAKLLQSPAESAAKMASLAVLLLGLMAVLAKKIGKLAEMGNHDRNGTNRRTPTNSR
jgi:hypothetical protein